jgi:hypothetical protein
MLTHIRAPRPPTTRHRGPQQHHRVVRRCAYPTQQPTRHRIHHAWYTVLIIISTFVPHLVEIHIHLH